MNSFRVLILSLLMPLSIHAHPGIGLVYDGESTIYYTDLVHIWKMDTQSGEASIFLENIHSHELWLDIDGSLYGEHYWYDESNQVFKHYIWMATTDGELTKISDTIVGENDHFSFIRENQYTSYSFSPFNSDFQFIKEISDSIKVFIATTLTNPGWMYLAQDSSIILSNRTSDNANQILSINLSNGNTKTLADNITISKLPFSFLDDSHQVFGIWQDDQANIYVALYGGRQVVRIDHEMNQETVLESSFFWSPVNGVFDSNNDLWLMEASLRGKVRVRKVSLIG